MGELTLDILKDQLDKQNGICPYTGISLKLPSLKINHARFEVASLDRIDSNKLYEKNNYLGEKDRKIKNSN